MGIKVAVLFFCLKALISKAFWLLSASATARQSEYHVANPVRKGAG